MPFPDGCSRVTSSKSAMLPSTNQNVVTYTAVVAVDNKDLKLRPGMTANARFITAERKNVLKLPLAAVRFRPPAGVTVIGDTNAPTAKAASGAALIEDGPFAGLPVMPWMSETAPAHRCGADCLCRNLDSGAEAEIRKSHGRVPCPHGPRRRTRWGRALGEAGSVAVPAAAPARDRDPNPTSPRR